MFLLFCFFQGDENVAVALLTYPVLMASDILLYQVVSPAISDRPRKSIALANYYIILWISSYFHFLQTYEEVKEHPLDS